MNLRYKKRIDYLLGGALIALFKLPTMFLGAILRRDHAPVLHKDVCFIKMQGGGSLVIAFPALLGLRRRYPECRFRLVCTSSVRPFAACLGIFDEILTVDDRSPFHLFTSGVSTLVKNFKVDTVIDLEVYSRLTTVFGLLTCARNRIGFYLENTFWRQHICSHLIFFNRYSGSFYFYEAIAHLLDAPIAEWAECGDLIRRNLPNSEAEEKKRVSHCDWPCLFRVGA
ncbi:hypothetical protein OR1_01196 [Geobacter sp. OR-1]|uniref:glycosyltransferase family 9 protein n=1 Tax=Geobacter sp. OR-1 TaxID=1266765 RepID=UPI000542BF41|nr:hypothetical protein [Geobacter sp. OR-1]GAM08922.1 hypothetical protein OR1_01196 [Geobacter sp. OR-1]